MYVSRKSSALYAALLAAQMRTTACVEPTVECLEAAPKPDDVPKQSRQVRRQEERQSRKRGLLP